MAFEFVFTTEEIREKMFGFLKNLRFREDFDFDIWTTGIFDKENNVFMTMIYFQSGLGHCYDDLKCIVIANNSDIFIAHLYGLIKNNKFDIPEEYENLRNIVKEGLTYYDDFEYLDDLDDITEEKKKELREINIIMNDRCRKSFMINCENDARKLFESCDFYYTTVLQKYNKKTVKAFDRYATEEKMLAWRSAEYKRLIEDCLIRKDFSSKYCYKICNLLWSGVDETYDRLYYYFIEEAIKQLNFDYCSVSDYIKTYTKKYPNKVSNLIPLLDMLESHINRILDMKTEIEKARKLINDEKE